MAAPQLIGRDAEVGALDELFIRGRVQGQAVVRTGEPGIGKSALLAVAGLAYGGWLRRQHRYREASEALHAVPEAFDRIGAVTWASLARAELNAAGTAGRDPQNCPPPGACR